MENKMSYFLTRKLFLTPSFDLDVKETQLFERFLQYLEDSGVGAVIEKHVKNDTNSGGRPNVNYYNLFAVILYGFANGNATLRDLADACGHDIRYIWIMEQVRPSYTTICNYINNVIVPNEDELFGLLVKQLVKEMKIELDDAFVDGSKFEANANKYKFVWKPETFHQRISKTFFELLEKVKICQTYSKEVMVKSKTVFSSICELEKKKDEIDLVQFEKTKKALNAILSKVLEYEEKERICGDGRRSYFKTDHDATAMCLKQDYYSGLGSNMHAAYNVQILVIKGLILAYYVSQSRTDCSDFISVLRNFFKHFSKYPKNVCADAGYGNLENYLFLNENGIGNYVKNISWEGNVNGRYPDCYYLNEDNTITCLNGRIGVETDIPGRHPKKANAVFFKITGCSDCGFKDYCMRYLKKDFHADFKVFEVVKQMAQLKQEAQQNLLSPKGIELRVNRSIQVEGAFGIEKYDQGYNRIRRRGLKNVSTEMMLYFFGLNLRKLMNYYTKGSSLTYWIAPPSLTAQELKKPSAKKLSKRGLKMHEKQYPEKN